MENLENSVKDSAQTYFHRYVKLNRVLFTNPFKNISFHLQSSVSLVYHDCFSPYCPAFLPDKKA